MKNLILILFLGLSYFSEAYSQDRVVDKKFTYWTRAYLEIPIAENLQVDLEIDNRRYIDPHRQFQTVVRATMAAEVNSWLSIGSGIAHSLLYSQLTDVSQPEIRPHQEVNMSHSSGNWDYNHRVRLEQRFLQDTTRTTNGAVQEYREDSFSFSFRSRYETYIGYTVINKEKGSGHLDLNASSEIMLNARLREIFNTYRIYTGITYFFNNSSSVELGYLLSFEYNHAYDTMFDYNNIRFTFRQVI